MPRKIERSVVDHAASLVLNGSTLISAGKKVGIDPPPSPESLRSLGSSHPVTGAVLKKINLPVNDIKTMYENGQSENAIAKHFGADRRTIRKRLLKAGIKPRSQGEAEKLKWSQMDQKTRSKQVKAAHNACRGRIHTFTEICQRAATREKKKA